MLLIGAVLITGASISALARGFGRGGRRVFLGGRGVAETVVKSREGRHKERTLAAETEDGPTDVMSTYPEADEFEPTVALVEDQVDDDSEAATRGLQPGAR